MLTEAPVDEFCEVCNALRSTLNFQCTLVEGLNPYKRLFTKKTDPYLRKKKTLIRKKKDPYLQKKKRPLFEKKPFF